MHPHHDSITTGSCGPPGSPGSLASSEVPPLQHLVLPFKLIDFRARMMSLGSRGRKVKYSTKYRPPWRIRLKARVDHANQNA